MGGRKGKAGIRDVSRQAPTEEERDQVFELIANMRTPHIVVAILGASLLEYELERLLRPRFAKKDDANWNRITGEHGPLETFSQKIMTAYAFSILDDVTKSGFLAVKNIRNAFAHSKRLIDFDHESIQSEIRGLKLPAKKQSPLAKDLGPIKTLEHGGKAAFICLCLFLSVQISKKRGAIAKRRVSRAVRSKRGPLYRSLMADVLLGRPPGSSKGLVGLFGGTYYHGTTPPRTLGDILGEYSASPTGKGILE